MALNKTRPLATAVEQVAVPCADLLRDLEQGDATTRRHAARDLIGCEGASAALVDRLLREDDRPVRDVIVTSLTRLGDPVAVSGLVECLRSDDAGLRNAAIEALKQLPDAVAPIIEGLLADADADVRIFAVNVLESLRHPGVEAWLVGVIDADVHVNVCATAVDLLAEVGSDAAVEALVRLQNRFDHEPYIQFAAGLALKRIRGC